MTTTEFYKKYNFKITNNEDLRDKEQGITPEVQKLLDKELKKISGGRLTGVVRRLKTLIGKHPKVPQFYNYLSAVYSQQGNTDEAFLTNRKLLEKFPNYLFAVTNAAKEQVFNENFEETKKILGEELTITGRYPDSTVFTRSEVVTFYEAVFQYYLKGEEDDKKAQEILEMMEAADIEHGSTRRCAFALIGFRAENMSGFFSKEQDIIYREYDKSVQTTKKPVFHFPEIEALYENGWDIDRAILQNILDLPRQELIADLEKVVMDALYRYEYFVKDYKENGWDEKEHLFPLHAIFLLTELKATESLPFIWKILKQGKDLNEFWFSDHLTETLWFDFYHLLDEDYSSFLSDLLDAEIYEFSKAPFAQALEQLFYHQEDKGKTIVSFYKLLMETALQQHKAGTAVDVDLFGMVVSDLISFDSKELLPLIRQMYERDLVDEMHCGDYEDVVESMQEKKKYLHKNKVPASIFDRYKKMIRYYGDSDLVEHPQTTIAKANQQAAKPVLQKKIGRNDPCICGSGKKFKKCCIKKFK